MRSQASAPPLELLLVVAYAIGLYSAVLLGDVMLAMSWEESWDKLPEHAENLRRLVYFYPAASLPLSMMVLAALAQQDQARPSRGSVFVNGLLACGAGNVLAFQAGKFLVGWTIAGEWAGHLNSYRLNILTAVVAPAVAYVAACVIALAIQALMGWVKPE